ncbi:uncharacterized protein LOC144101535 [Amblyomma americanum]
MATEHEVRLFAHNLWQDRLAGLQPQPRRVDQDNPGSGVAVVGSYLIEEHLIVFAFAAGSVLGMHLKGALDNRGAIDAAIAQEDEECLLSATHLHCHPGKKILTTDLSQLRSRGIHGCPTWNICRDYRPWLYHFPDRRQQKALLVPGFARSVQTQPQDRAVFGCISQCHTGAMVSFVVWQEHLQTALQHQEVRLARQSSSLVRLELARDTALRSTSGHAAGLRGSAERPAPAWRRHHVR